MLCNILQQYDYLKLSTRIVIKKKKSIASPYWLWMGQTAPHSELHTSNQHVAVDKILPAQEAGSFQPPPTPLEYNGFCISLRPHCLPICLLTKARDHATFLSPESTKLLPMSQSEAWNPHFPHLHRAASFSPFKSPWKCRPLREGFPYNSSWSIFLFSSKHVSVSQLKYKFYEGKAFVFSPRKRLAQSTCSMNVCSMIKQLNTWLTLIMWSSKKGIANAAEHNGQADAAEPHCLGLLSGSAT